MYSGCMGLVGLCRRVSVSSAYADWVGVLVG